MTEKTRELLERGANAVVNGMSNRVIDKGTIEGLLLILRELDGVGPLEEIMKRLDEQDLKIQRLNNVLEIAKIKGPRVA